MVERYYRNTSDPPKYAVPLSLGKNMSERGVLLWPNALKISGKARKS